MPSPGAPQVGLCVELYSLQTLAHRTIAFDGTVTAINGDNVEFHVNRAFRGVNGTSVALTGQGMTGGAIVSVDGPDLKVGGRYLVAGEDHFAWGCGFTQPYDAALASQWATAFEP